MTEQRSRLYEGYVTHRRMHPLKLRFVYRVFMMFLDLEELPDLGRHGWIFGYNRPALLSFYDHDHGPRDGSPLIPWVQEKLAAAGLTYRGLTTRILAMPRFMGYVFNPLSIIFCSDEEGKLFAVLYEVKNTFGDQHVYLFSVPASNNNHGLLHQNCLKSFYVSPFMENAGSYRFRLRPPGENFNLFIAHELDGLEDFCATWSGKQEAWSAKNLLRAWLRYPLLTFKVMFAIHWQALKLFAGGAKFRRRPQGTKDNISFHVSD